MNNKPLLLLMTMVLGFVFTVQGQVVNKMNELLEASKAPGCNFSIIYEDGTQENYSAGYADVDEKIAMTPEHSIFSGSIGKTYAIAALMQLVDEGKVDLNKKWKEYFPDVEWIRNLPNVNDFTVLHLMQHRSGLPRYAFKEKIWELILADRDKVWSYKERLEYVFGDEPVHPAGEGFAYSDTGYLLIGMLIEKITGQYLYDAIQQRVLYPLGLKYTYPADRRTLPNHANTYSKDPVFHMPGAVFTKGVCNYNPQFENTGGGFTSRTSDLVKWVKMYYDGKPFSEESKKVVQTISEHGKDVYEGWSCAAGMFILDSKYGKAYGHTGLMTGARSIMMYFPDIKIAAAFQMNSDKDEGGLGLLGHLEVLVETALEVKK